MEVGVGNGRVGLGTWLGVGVAERVTERREHVVRHLLLHPLDLGLLLRVLCDQRADAVLTEADMSALVGDRPPQGLGELGVGFPVAGLQQFEHGEGHALQHDVLPDHAGDEVTVVHLLEEHLGELDEVRVGVAVDRRLEVVLLHTEVEEALGEDLDVARLVEGLRGEEPLARIVGGGVDQAGRRREGTPLADHQADRGADGGLALVVVREDELGLGRVGLVPVDGVFEVALRAHLHPPLDRVLREEFSHVGTDFSDWNNVPDLERCSNIGRSDSRWQGLWSRTAGREEISSERSAEDVGQRVDGTVDVRGRRVVDERQPHHSPVRVDAETIEHTRRVVVAGTRLDAALHELVRNLPGIPRAG